MKKRLLFGFIFTLSLVIPTNVYASTWNKDLDVVTRISGTDRYATNISASQKWMEYHQKNAVVIANGESYPDSIISVSLSHSQDIASSGTSVLLYNPAYSSLTTAVKNEISRLLNPRGPKKVLIVGGVPASVDSELRSLGYNPERLSGSDRYETSYQVAKKIYQNATPNTVIISHDYNFADSIGVLGWAGFNNFPVLLSSPDYLSSAAERAITENSNIKNAIIFGSTAVMSSNVENRLRALGLNVTRYAGSDRYATNILFNQSKTNYSDGRLMFATTGEDFPDAISTGFNAARKGRPIVLTSNTSLSSDAQSFIKNQSDMTEQIEHIYLIGGSVNSDTKNSIFSAGWWWAPWATLYVEDVDPGSKLKITSYMDFYSSIPSDLGPTNTSDVDYENNMFLPNNQNLSVYDTYTNLPMQYYWYVFIDFDHTGTEHDWSVGTDVPEQLTSSQTYYVQHIVVRANGLFTIPTASNLKIYSESQFKIYGPNDNSLLLIDNLPAFKFIDMKNL